MCSTGFSLDSPSHRLLASLTTKTPCNPLRLESQTPVDGSKPTQPPSRLIRGEAQARHSVVDGPVHDAQAGEQLGRELERR
jgi:hypothetical protein